MNDDAADALYRDKWITCTPSAVVIRGYYFPLASAKTVPYGDIRRVDEVDLGSGRWRIWGGTDPRYWFHLDPQRPHKREALVLELGKLIRPVITPDDPQAVKSILERHRAAA